MLALSFDRGIDSAEKKGGPDVGREWAWPRCCCSFGPLICRSFWRRGRPAAGSAAVGLVRNTGPVWYSFMSSITISIAKQPTLCPASLKIHSHRVKHMVKLPKHGSLPRS
jgi:hypothetical protein